MAVGASLIPTTGSFLKIGKLFRFYGYERDSNKGFTKKVIFLLFLSLWLLWV